MRAIGRTRRHMAYSSGPKNFIWISFKEDLSYLKTSCHIGLFSSSIHEKDVKVKLLTTTDT
jgi:hypothetical protein